MRIKLLTCLALIVALVLPSLSRAQFLANAEIRVYALQIDVDARPDLDGLQYTMSSLKEVPVSVRTVVGDPNAVSNPDIPAGSLVKATLTGPAFSQNGIPVAALPNHPFELPTLRTAGDYTLSNIRLEGPDGQVLARRSLIRESVVITVIDELLVTTVSSRALSAAEIEEKGIVIDEDNFTVLNFAMQ